MAMTAKPLPKCGAKKHQGTGTCTRPAGWGTTHPGTGRCKLHGGSTPQHRASAADDQARISLNREGLVPITNPVAELQALAAEVVGLKDIFATEVEKLRGWDYTDKEGRQEAVVVLQAYERALDRSERILVSMARLNLDEKMARINEAQGKQYLGIMERAFAAVKMPAELRSQVIEATAVEVNRVVRSN